ncbi:MAG: single-stranded-DNA-specific exonuclease RecJ [Steroidobacteraceae bacterium]
MRVQRRPVDRSNALPGLNPVLARVYAARGVRSPRDIDLSLGEMLPVSSLQGIDAAIELLMAHRSPQRRVMVIGDFDADGATSTALAVRALRSMEFSHVDYLVPNRSEFGYGLTPEIVAVAAARRPTLIITVDNGISSLQGVRRARELGIDVLVTDHHLPGPELPNANVIVNPNCQQGEFGSRSLAGVGVIFYVCAALQRALAASSAAARATRVADWLDLVALGTVADLVPLDRNNRVLVAQGLSRIRAGRCVPGLRALMQLAGRELGSANSADLGFTVGPRLNAAGRIDDMSIGIQCLLTDDESTARMLAARLDQLNGERRAIEAQMQQTALAAVRHLRDGPLADARRGVTLYEADWHQGIVGLVASRIKDRLRRPVVAFARAGDALLRGSARSVAGVHVRDVLARIDALHPQLIVRFGGHAMAAGLTLHEEQIETFAEAFDTAVREAQGDAIRADVVETDGELSVEELSLQTAAALRDGGPWGPLFPEPSFDGQFRLSQARVVGERHLKLWLEHCESGRRFDAIAFGYLAPGEVLQRLPGDARVVYRLDVNSFRGETRLQLLVDHLIC